MAETYYIYSIKMQGWITRSYTYGTSLDEARQFPREEALELCRSRSDHNGSPTCFIVPTWFHVEMGGHK